MKYFYLLIALFLIVGCGSDDSVTVEPPVAVNDSATTSENTALTITVLQNDDLKNNASITNFDNVTINNGTVFKSQNKFFIYTPADNFTGTDSFTYTICDALSTPNCSTATVTIEVTDEGTPIALDDAFEVVENTITIFDVLDNDTLRDGAELSSVDVNSSSGTAVINTDGTISYTAANGFSGEDSFTYSLCDNDETPTCVTATVTVTVTDEGTPTANNDTFNILENSSSTILAILSNDVLTDEATVSSIDVTTASGTVQLNTDGTISYMPQTDFTGGDSFMYTICDDDATPSCSTATVTIKVITPISFNIPAELVDYYSNVVFSEDPDLTFDELENLTQTKHTTLLSYAQRHQYLYNADADLSNPDNVILMYSGESRYWEEYTSPSNSYSPQTFNTEHIYPQSLLVATDAANDLHHMRTCDETINGIRSNNPYIDDSGTYKLVGDAWYPGDDWRGDVARMIMYLNIRYGESFNRVGGLDLFIKWNIEDPVSPFEEQRNNVIYSAQGNRNPFIDNPYLATLIWGGNDAENRWN